MSQYNNVSLNVMSRRMQNQDTSSRSPGQESIQTLGLQSSVYVNIRDTRVLALITRMSAKACFVGDLVAGSLNVLC